MKEDTKLRREAEPTERISLAWYLLPILLSFIGGIIEWAVIKERNKKVAINLLIVGVVVTIINFIIAFLLLM